MKAIRTAALSRAHAPEFLVFSRWELVTLRQVAHLARSMFTELVGMSQFKTGRVETSYAVLASLLDWDRAPGAHADPAPSLQRLRTALQHLVDVGLVVIDRVRNAKTQGLFLKVRPRSGISSADENSNRGSNRVPKEPTPPKKRTKSATCDTPTPAPSTGEQQGGQQRVQENLLPLSPSPLSQPATDQVDQRGQFLETWAQRRRGGQQAPQGGQGVAPPSASHAPPGPDRLRPIRPCQTDEGPAARSAPPRPCAGHGAGAAAARPREG